jgi:hypothetical protein
MQRPHESERHVVDERTILVAITARLPGRRLPVLSLVTLRSAEKGHLLRDDLHDLMLCSFSILIAAGLNPPLNRDEPLGAAEIYVKQ